ncbi:hypothetical protein FBU31_004018, partial [Coemansia sp. 'formosensis']
DEHQVVDSKVLDVIRRAPNEQLGEAIDVVGVDVFGIDVGVALAVNEVAQLEAGDVGDEAGEQRKRGNVEVHAEPNVARVLVHLTRQGSIG